MQVICATGCGFWKAVQRLGENSGPAEGKKQGKRRGDLWLVVSPSSCMRGNMLGRCCGKPCREVLSGLVSPVLMTLGMVTLVPGRHCRRSHSRARRWAVAMSAAVISPEISLR